MVSTGLKEVFVGVVVGNIILSIIFTLLRHEMVVSDEFVEQNSWMVRPCSIYKEEYSDCTSIRSRLYQYFINGSFSVCKQWKRDYNNCNEWKDRQDRKAFKELIDSELSRREERLSAQRGNDTWEKRCDIPPPGWNGPLPEFIEERMKSSYLTARAKEYQNGTVQESSFCTIS